MSQVIKGNDGFNLDWLKPKYFGVREARKQHKQVYSFIFFPSS